MPTYTVTLTAGQLEILLYLLDKEFPLYKSKEEQQWYKSLMQQLQNALVDTEAEKPL